MCSVTRYRREFVFVRASDNRAATRRRHDQRACLQTVNFLQLRAIYLPRLALPYRVPALQPCRRGVAAARASSEINAIRVSAFNAVVFSNCLKRECLQCIAGENRGCFVEAHVTRWPAASQIVVVHRRQIVVNERVGMDHLKRARGPDQQPETARSNA